MPELEIMSLFLSSGQRVHFARAPSDKMFDIYGYHMSVRIASQSANTFVIYPYHLESAESADHIAAFPNDFLFHQQLEEVGTFGLMLPHPVPTRYLTMGPSADVGFNAILTIFYNIRTGSDIERAWEFIGKFR